MLGTARLKRKLQMLYSQALSNGLEGYRCRELKLARGGADRHSGDQASAGAAVDAGIARISCGDVVEGVECIHSKLAFDAFLDGDVLQQREIVVEVGGSSEGIARRRAELVETGPGERSSSDEALRDGKVPALMIDRIEAGEIELKIPRSFIGTAWSRGNVRAALAVRCCEWKAARQIQRGAELVSTNQVVDQAVGTGQEPAALAERQVVGAIELDCLFAQIVVAAVVYLAVDLLIVASRVEGTLPGIAGGKLQAVSEALLKAGLKGVIVGVKPIMVVGQILRPAS